MTEPRFDQLAIDPLILRAIEAEGYTSPTPIQQQAIPHGLLGRDLLALAQTGTGKTAAFAVPLLQHLHKVKGPREIRALILAPTRELALQVAASLRAYGKNLNLRVAVILGGVAQGGQVSELKRRPEILVATPGRLLDLHEQGFIKLGSVEVLVLDEADRMLDMGFIHDVRRIVAQVPKKRQTLFFSATMPPAVTELANSMLVDPVRVQVAPTATVAAKVEQNVMFVNHDKKQALLMHLLQYPSAQRVLVFARTRHRANRVERQLKRAGVKAEAIHSDKSQNARQRALAAFADGKVRVLVATDIMARGIDVDDISHVVNFDLPDEAESYVHRIGRTARAAATGIAISFCDAEEVGDLRAIERLTRQPVPQDRDQPFHSELAAAKYDTEGRGQKPPTPRPRGNRPRFQGPRPQRPASAGPKGRPPRRRNRR